MLPILKENSQKKVAAYVRVSTKEKLQLESLNNQIEHYKNLFKDNPNYKLIDIFIDEGISGTSTSKRKGLKELLELAEKKEIDLILTKSISRLARNTLDLLNIITKLKNLNVEVYFEKEAFSSFSKDTDLLMSLLAAFAEIESENISSNIRWRINKEMENGRSFRKFKILGYSWNNNNLVVNKDEAWIIENIYLRYEKGDSGRAIASFLNSLNLKIDRHFDSSSIYYILRNQIYAGDLILGKYYTLSPINKKIKKNNGEKKMYVVKNNHEAIIEKERWFKIQDLILKRGKHHA